ncbi:MAG: SDR family NAD(P)-dependent oxidoreductase [Candidatus Coatesbacteria bacterium]
MSDSEPRFKGQVAVVTGGGDGMGKAIAKRLASEGAKVAIFDINPDAMEKAQIELRKAGLGALSVKCDVTHEESVRGAFERIMVVGKRIDIVVNCAGIPGPTATKVADYSLADFRHVVNVNLTGSFLVAKHAIPLMLQNDYGRLLLLSSIGGKEGNPGMAGYVASKSGVIGLVKGLGKEYAETGVRVNGLAPAVIQTALLDAVKPEQLKYMVDKIPMKRVGTVDEVAALAAWIVSKECSFTTGFVFDASGGRATY